MQIRNKQNLFRDSQDELNTYQYSKMAVEIAASMVSDTSSIADNLSNIYESLLKNAIVKSHELQALDAYLKDKT